MCVTRTTILANQKMKTAQPVCPRRVTGRSSAMIKSPSHRREGLPRRLSEATREVVAAWFVLLFLIVAGASFLAFHQYRIADCATRAAMPGMHRSLADEHEWDVRACSIGLCGPSLSTQEFDSDSMQATQSSGGDPSPYSGSSSMPTAVHEKSGTQDQRQSKPENLRETTSITTFAAGRQKVTGAISRDGRAQLRLGRAAGRYRSRSSMSLRETGHRTR